MMDNKPVIETRVVRMRKDNDHRAGLVNNLEDKIKWRLNIL